MGRGLRNGAALVASGAIGAGIAIGVGAATWPDSGTTTVIEKTAAATPAVTEVSQPASFSATGSNLSIQEIYRRSGPGVVQIVASTTKSSSTDPLDQQQSQRALGSGFVISKTGHIVTNYHVVQNAEEIEVNFSGGDRVKASLVGVDPSTDLAVLKVDMPSDALTPLVLADSDKVQVGDAVVAIGNPFGLDRTVTSGIVSAVQRSITSPNDFQIDHVIQTDAAINHGNSGGPLLNGQGEVIGVNSQIETGGYAEGNVGVGFAVPSNTVKDVVSQLIETGKVERAFLGIEMQTISADSADSLRLPVSKGVLVATVRPGSPADKAGLEGGTSSAVVDGQTWVLGGDVIVKADGKAIENSDQLRDIVLAKKPDDILTLEVNRDGKIVTLSVKLGRQPITPTG
jgi:S1-C subfamily serine protease